MRLGFLGDSMEWQGDLCGKPWPLLACEILSEQGQTWAAANHSLPGFTATLMANAIEFNQAVPGSTSAWAEITSGEDYHVLTCGVNDALLQVDRPVLNVQQQKDAANYLINGCLRIAPKLNQPLKPIIFTAMQFVPPGTYEPFDEYLTYVGGLCDYVVTIPYYQLRGPEPQGMNLLMDDAAVFNQVPPAIQIAGYHPKAIGSRFIAAEWVRQMSEKLPLIFTHQPSTYPQWDSWAAAFEECQANSAIWQALKSNWD